MDFPKLDVNHSAGCISHDQCQVPYGSLAKIYL